MRKLLANYQSALMSDGYLGYDAIANKFNIVHLGRYFTKVLDKGTNANDQKMVELIGQLYVIEKSIKAIQN